MDSNGYYKISPRGSSSFIRGSGTSVITGSSQTNNSDEWMISQYIDYVLAYVGDSSSDYRMVCLRNNAESNLKENANAVGIAYTTMTNEDCALFIQETDVFISLSHGTKDSIKLSGTTSSSCTYFSINYMEEENIANLSNLKFVFFAACLTGEGRTGADNLVNAVKDRGAKNVLGFTIEVNQEETNEWTKEFVSSLSEGNTIGAAMDDADEKVSENSEYTNLTTTSTYRYFVGNMNYIPFN